MRIVLVQAEIEMALRAYVLNQISVKEGQNITISFKNTRGDDGSTAEIDITPPVQAYSKPTVAYRAPSTGSSTRSMEAPQEASEEPQEGNEPAVCPAPAVEDTSDTTTSQEASAPAASSPSQKTEGKFTPEVVKSEGGSKPVAEASDVPPPSKSLFANLTKPVNNSA